MPFVIGLLLALVVLGLAGAAVWLAYPLRRRVDQLTGDVNSLQVALEDLRSEVSELRAAAQVVPVPPPLPKSRPGGLDDLRQQLRAAHSESAEPSEE
jgi:outer membrane murein-binding lipoprotein Lpp